jgi:peptidoglycan hydrolase-like protein with peptidoglycan-binding domain
MKRASLIAIALAASAALASPAMAANGVGAGAGANGAGVGAGVNANGGGAGGGANGGAGNRVGEGGALITISPSGVRQVQQALNRLGYYAGHVDGVWDRASADAMVHFQEAHGLEPTGNLNFSSIAGLGLWDDLIGNPIGNNNKALEASTGAPPARGNGKTTINGNAPLPSQRLTTTGGGVTGSNTATTGGAANGTAAGGGGAAGGGAANRP